MNDYLKLLGESFSRSGEELIISIFLISLLLAVYYWLSIRLSGIIQSVFLRRNAIALLAFTIFSIIFYKEWAGRPELSRDYLSQDYFPMVISAITFFNLYYLFDNHFRDNKQRWIPFLKFFIMFIMIWLCMSSPSLFQFGIKKNYTYNYIGTNLQSIPKADIMHRFKVDLLIFAEIALLASLIDVGCRYVIKMQQFRKQQKELETIKIKEQLTKAQLDALNAKVNPHFLYNALNSIAGLALTDGTKTRQMAVSLSKFFRYSINQEQNNLVTLKEELAMVETYLEIEKIRFEDRLNFEIVVQPGLEQLKIPRFILQPLVENSVKHGLKGTRHELFIRIQAQLDGTKLALSIRDDGLPFAADMKPGYGFKSVYDKLDLLFPDKYEVALFNEPLKQVKILIET